MQVSILGLGLMGGAIGLGLKKCGFEGIITGWARREEVRREALEKKVVDRVCEDPAAAVEDADLVVLCVPVLAMPALLETCRPALGTAVVTDVGSTKAVLTASAMQLLADSSAVFVGSHPIAGSEQEGLAAARAELYKGAAVVITPVEDAPVEAVETVDAFWRGLGAITISMSPEAHDKILARTSHLPHVAAAALASSVNRAGEGEEAGPFCGTGFEDTSRIADGSPAVWLDILCSNRTAVAEELQAYAEMLKRYADALEQGNADQILNLLELGRADRRALLQKKMESKKT